MSDQHWIWSTDRHIASDTAQGHRVVSELLDQLKQRGWSEHDLFSVHLAIEEALVNAVKHGNRYDRNKTIHVVCKLNPDKVRIEVSDQGDGFDPDNLPDPTLEANLERPFGRGVMLMRKFMDELKFNARGNALVMERRRSDPCPASAEELK